MKRKIFIPQNKYLERKTFMKKTGSNKFLPFASRQNTKSKKSEKA